MVSNLSTDNLRQGFDLICLSEWWAISAPPPTWAVVVFRGYDEIYWSIRCVLSTKRVPGLLQSETPSPIPMLHLANNSKPHCTVKQRNSTTSPRKHANYRFIRGIDEARQLPY